MRKPLFPHLFFVFPYLLQAAQESPEYKENTYIFEDAASYTQKAWCKINKNESIPLASYDQNTIHAIQTIVLATYRDGGEEEPYGNSLKRLIDLCSGDKDVWLYYQILEKGEFFEKKTRQFTIKRNLKDEYENINIAIKFKFIREKSIFMTIIQEPGIRNLYRTSKDGVAIDKAALTLYFDHKKEIFKKEAILYTNIDSGKKISLKYKAVSTQKIIQVDKENLEWAKNVGIQGLKQKGFTLSTLGIIVFLADMYKKQLEN